MIPVKVRTIALFDLTKSGLNFLLGFALWVIKTGMFAAAILALLLVFLLWFDVIWLSNAESFSMEDAQQHDRYSLPLESAQDAVAYANYLGYFSEANISEVSTDNIFKSYVAVEKKSLQPFAQNVQSEFDSGQIGKAEYQNLISEAVPDAVYWRVSYRPNERCILAIKPSGRLLEHWSQGCGFKNYQ